MKKLIYGGVIFTSLMFLAIACQKENVQPNSVAQVSQTTKSVKFIDTPQEKIGGKRGEIACSVMDSNGKEICAGNRVGTPVGNCGANYTNCKCVAELPPSSPADPLGFTKEKLYDGLTKADFIAKWNTEKGRRELISKGYYEVDVH